MSLPVGKRDLLDILAFYGALISVVYNIITCLHIKDCGYYTALG